MKSNQFITDAEDSPTTQKISEILTSYGYKKIGSGADKTVWHRVGDNVVGIIMPANKSLDTAMKSFITLYNLSRKYPDNPHFPEFVKFVDENGISSHFNQFTIDNRQFVQYGMKRYYRIKNLNIFKLVDKLRSLAYRNLDIIHVRNIMKYSDLQKDDSIRRYLDNYEELYETIKLILNSAPDDTMVDVFDVKNMMQKSDGTLVFVDPYYNSDFLRRSNMRVM